MENKWMTVKVKYNKPQEDGCIKRVTESFLVSAYTFTDAEAMIYEKMDYIKGEFEVCSIVKTELMDILRSEDDNSYWDAKIKTIREDSEKPLVYNLLVQASSVADANKKIEESISNSIFSFSITAVKSSAIVEIFENNE